MNRRLPAWLGTRDDDPVAVFVRGATVGSFVGAVIAGSTIWRRLRRPAASSPPANAAGARAVPAADAPVASSRRGRGTATPSAGADAHRR